MKTMLAPLTPPRKPIRVLYVHHVSGAGGSARSLQLLIQHLPQGSVEPIVVVPPGVAAAGFREAGARVLTTRGVSAFVDHPGGEFRGLRLLALGREAWKLRHGRVLRSMIAETRPDVVHLNERGMFQAARASWQAGVPVVMHARSAADNTNRWFPIVERHFGAYVSEVIAIDESVRRSLTAYENSRVIYNPLPFPPPQSRSPRHSRQQIIVMYLCSLLRYKGIWDLLSAARILRHRRDIVFHIYGGNVRPAEFFRTPRGRLCSTFGLVRDMEKATRRWVVREGLHETVRFFGKVTLSAALFQEADILAFPSHANALSRSVFEAGICGIPSVVSLDDKVEDIVEDNVTGVITKPRDPASFAQAIQKLADDQQLRERLGQNAQRKYAAQFNPATIGSQVLSVYESVLNEPKARLKRLHQRRAA
jgi:glycosyltransferase involved in cell wall biosynthesis